MRDFPKSLLVPFLFYLIAFICDASITSYGISNGGSEGNPLVVWLWSIFGQDSFILKVVYVFIIFSVSYLIYKYINKFVGVLIPYSLGVGHVLGFSTWVFMYANHFGLEIIHQFHRLLVPNGLYILAPIGGAILSFVHIKIFKD